MQPTDLRADAARNREKILRIAREQLNNGDTSLAMNVIARQAGVGVGTVYRHFPTRQVLLETLAMHSFEQLLGHARAAAAEADPRTGLRNLLTAALVCLLDDAGLVAVLRSPQCACTETSQLQVELLGALGRLLEGAREVGAIRPDVRADDLRRYLLGLEQAVRLGSREQDQIRRDLEILLLGLQPHLHNQLPASAPIGSHGGRMIGSSSSAACSSAGR